MRVIAGELRGRRLASAKGLRVRPTADRVKESVFSILSGCVTGAAVLDLFSGTGALAIEALSRGAASAVLVDVHIQSLDLIRKNLDACRLGPKARVIRWDIEKDLHCLRGQDPLFDLVFMDPPYERSLVLPVLANLAHSHCLAPDARIVVEHGQREPDPGSAAAFALEDRRRYGKTLVSFLSPVV